MLYLSWVWRNSDHSWWRGKWFYQTAAAAIQKHGHVCVARNEEKQARWDQSSIDLSPLCTTWVTCKIVLIVLLFVFICSFKTHLWCRWAAEMAGRHQRAILQVEIWWKTKHHTTLYGWSELERRMGSSNKFKAFYGSQTALYCGVQDWERYF